MTTNALATVKNTALSTAALGNLSPSQLRTLKTTIASDCNESEFDLYMGVVGSTRLDPFRRQVLPIIFNKSDANRRRMSIVISQDGLRTLAARQGDYRPASAEPVVYRTRDWLAREKAIETAYAIPKKAERDKALAEVDANFPADPTNPLGIEKVTVTLFKKDGNEWFPVLGEAHWTEYAPIKQEAEAYEWIETGETYPDSGRPKKRKVPVRGAARVAKLDDSGQWAKMPYIMIVKCATMQALRAGWPDTFASLYAEEELDRAKAEEFTASELVEQAEVERRRQAINVGSDEYPFVDDNGTLRFVPAGKYADEVIKLAMTYKSADQLNAMRVRNRDSLQRFWAMHKADATDLKEKLEAIHARVAKVIDNAA